MEIWTYILGLQGKTLKTLDQRKPFDVSYVGSDVVIVTPHKSRKARSIDRDTIENTFAELLTRRELSRVEIQKHYSSFNPAYVAAILTEIPGVNYRIRPIILCYRQS